MEREPRIRNKFGNFPDLGKLQLNHLGMWKKAEWSASR